MIKIGVFNNCIRGNSMKKQNLFLAALLATLNFTSLFTSATHTAKQHFQELNQEAPFVVSFGVAKSQIHDSNNTINPIFVAEQLQKMAQKAKDAYKFLMHPEHIGYLLCALSIYKCTNCNKVIDPRTLNPKNELAQPQIEKIVKELCNNLHEKTLTLKTCPLCETGLLEKLSPEFMKFTEEHKQAMRAQIDWLGVTNQLACTKFKFPNYRFDVELSDMCDQEGNIDQEKLNIEAKFVKELSNPFLFAHHYTNPLCKPDLFENQETVHWFVNTVAQVVDRMDNITHFCPISQPTAFANRIYRATLPPFEPCDKTVNLNTYLENITAAQKLVCQKIKSNRIAKGLAPLKVFMSHQWKIFRPQHSFTSPWYLLEKLICNIANSKYNGAFVKMFSECRDLFDGIALSVYPCVKFNGWIPNGDNCAGAYSEEDAFDTIMAVHTQFPEKEIFIVETGCNTNDPEIKEGFIDMTLRVCKRARAMGAKISGVYFWGHANGSSYREWNIVPTPENKPCFGPFETLDPKIQPQLAANPAGLCLKRLLE
jgi:hypothetical protein